jgi:multidrug efflux pump subunit AcrB
MSLSAVAVQNRIVTYFFVILLLIAGTGSFFMLGQLEDPEFTVKTAVIVTAYPGASPREAELEVTDRIELAIQEMPQVDYLKSFSRAGLSLIEVNIKPEYWSDRLPQVWDELRRKVRDTEHQLPPGAGRPDVSDDFGDVFGFQLAVTGDGFSYSELEEYAKDLKKELSLVTGVSRVDLWGVQQKVVYIEVAQQQLTELGMTDESILKTLNEQNMVVDAGSLDLQNNRYRIAPTGEYRSPTEIADVVIRPSLGDEVINLMAAAEGGDGQTRRRSSELIRIGDVANVRRGYLELPQTLMRFDGEPSVGISITNASGVNVVHVGQAIDQRLSELLPELPVGVEVHRLHWMSDIVDESIQGFLINFGEAVLIVLVVITLGMGWRMGIIIGTALIATILGSFILMAIFGIDLQRMSLGALVVALGMMVDNAIVVADGYSVRLQKGMDRTKAAIEAASQPSWSLLGATIIAVMAFYPIFASVEDAGEYCRTLFTVVAISLLFSWLVSMTVTPLQCIDMLKTSGAKEGADPYDTPFFRRYCSLLAMAIRARWLTIGSVVALLVVAVIGFGNVKQLFFPDSSMTKIMVDYWAPEGTRIQQVAADLERAEQHLLADERIDSVASFIGSGPPRFYLPVDPEYSYPSYAQLIVNVRDRKEIDGLIADLGPWFKQTYPDALVPMRKYGVGPSNTWKFEVRISGPAEADPGVLRALADEGTDILRDSPLVGAYRIDWRQRTQRLAPQYNQQRARWAAVSRSDLGATTKRAFDGRTIGLYREGDDLIPIVGRFKEEQRQRVSDLDVLQIVPELSLNRLPVAAVTDGVTLEWEDPLIWRYNRRRTVTIQANPIPGVTLPTLRASVLDAFDAIELPSGYRLDWGAEFEDTRDAQASLMPGMIPAGVVILSIIVILFNAPRPPLVILLTLPFVLIGIVAGLLAFNTPFGFLALLGAMSLAGMMIKNAIVLLDEINLNLDKGLEPYQAVIEAGTSRLSPVILAAATTVLGVAPLLQDVFWVGMSVTIMVGLSFGTILTMILVPTVYATLYRIPSPQPAPASASVS